MVRASVCQTSGGEGGALEGGEYVEEGAEHTTLVWSEHCSSSNILHTCIWRMRIRKRMRSGRGIKIKHDLIRFSAANLLQRIYCPGKRQ